MTEKRYYHTHLQTAIAPAQAVQGTVGSVGIGTVEKNALQQVFKAPWQGISLVRLDAGASLGPRELKDSEVIFYVTSGTGVARFDGGDVNLREGMSVAFLMGSTLHIENTAKNELLEVFLAEMGK